MDSDPTGESDHDFDHELDRAIDFLDTGMQLQDRVKTLFGVLPVASRPRVARQVTTACWKAGMNMPWSRLPDDEPGHVLTLLLRDLQPPTFVHPEGAVIDTERLQRLRVEIELIFATEALHLTGGK